MNLSKLVFVTMIVLCASSRLFSMEAAQQEITFKPCSNNDPLSFEIHTNKLHLQLRQVFLFDPDTQNNPDRETLKKHVGDFDAVQAAFGTFIACGVKTLHFFSADSALELYLEGCKSTYKKMPADKKILYFWYIEDLDRSNKFMGQVTVSTYTDPVPAAYADTHLLSLSLVVAKKYRNKGITSRIAVAVHRYLSTLEPFQNGTFCFDTRTDNIAMHKIANNLGAQLIDTRDKVIDFEIIDNPAFPSYTIPSDLFIIPRQ